MTTIVTNGSSTHHFGDSSAKIAVKSCTDHTLKVETIFKKEITEPAQVPQDDEREVLIAYIRSEKKVSREVAAAEYDSL